MTAILALALIGAALYSIRRAFWHVLKVNRRVNADIAFMQAMPSRMDGQL